MNSSDSKSSSTIRERRRTPMACMNCRSRKLKCRLAESADGVTCERCVKDGAFCEYRPVDLGLNSNNQPSNYQDNPVILYPVNTAPPPNQEPAIHESYPPYVPQGGGYVPDPTYNQALQGHYQTANPHYPTAPYQQQHSSSYPITQYSYPNTFPSGYPADPSNYQSSSQFVGHPQYMPGQYPPVQGQGNGQYADQRDYSFNGYENTNGSNSTIE